MASFGLKRQLEGLLNSMFREGLLDKQFSRLHSLQDPNSPDFMDELITMFIRDSQTILEKLITLMSFINFQSADDYANQLMINSSSVGAQRLRQACVVFQQFCRDSDKNGCLRTLNIIRNEFHDLRAKLQSMMQLQERIRDYEDIHQRRR